MQNPQKLSSTGNTWLNTPGIQKVNAMFSRVRSSYKSYRTVELGYESLTELTELFGIDMKVLENSQYSWVKETKVLQKLQNYWVMVQSLIELTEVVG